MADIIDGRIGAHKLYQAIVWEQGFVGKIVKICFGFLIPFLRFFAAETATPKRRRHILWLWGLILRAPVTQIPFLNPLCTDCDRGKLTELGSCGLALRVVALHLLRLGKGVLVSVLSAHFVLTLANCFRLFC